MVHDISTAVLLLTVFLSSAASETSQTPQPQCTSPDSRPGRCVELNLCSEIRRLVSVKRNMTSAEKNLVRNSFCGGVPTKPKVCCPLVPTACGPIIQDKIVGGREVRLMQFPWMAAVGAENAEADAKDFWCGGSLISNRYILTAAHCVQNKKGLIPSVVTLGEHDLANEEKDCETRNNATICAPLPVDVHVAEHIVHERYNNETVTGAYDIALLRLKDPVQFTEAVTPICLPVDEAEQNINLVGKNVLVAGWGRTINYRGTIDSADANTKLNSVALPVLPVAECAKELPINIKIEKSVICAGGKPSQDSCRGDSGGPLFRHGASQSSQMVQFGIVSFGGNPCGMERVPAVYTHVGKFMPWILSNMFI